MLAALATLVLTQPAAVVVVSTSNRAGVGPQAAAVVAVVRRELAARSVPGLIDTPLDGSACESLRPCVAKLAARVGPSAWVVGVDVGKLGRSLAVNLEVIDATETVLATQRFTAPASGWEARAVPALDALAKELLRLRPAPAPEPPPLATLEPEPEPAPTPAPAPRPEPAPPAAVTAELPPAPSRVPLFAGVGASVGAVGSAAIAVTFFVLGLQDSAEIANAGDGDHSRLTRTQLMETSARGNGRFTLATTFSIATVAFAALAAVLFIWGRP